MQPVYAKKKYDICLLCVREREKSFSKFITIDIFFRFLANYISALIVSPLYIVHILLFDAIAFN